MLGKGARNRSEQNNTGESRVPEVFLCDFRWALYGVVYRFALKRNPPGKSRLISLAAVLFLQSYWVITAFLVGEVVLRRGEPATWFAARHGSSDVAVVLALVALYLMNRFWIFQEDHYSAYAERRARWERSTFRWEGLVSIAVLLATVAVVPAYKWLLR